MKVVVLVGGDSAERDVSLASGRGLIKALRNRGHDVHAIDPALPLDMQEEPGEVYIGREPPKDIPAIPPALKFEWLRAPQIVEADIVFVGLHGGAGEDGTVQAMLDAAGISYTGTGVLGSALAMNKDRSKALFRETGVQTAPHLFIDRTKGTDTAYVQEMIENAVGFPAVIKPNCQGSSVGFSFVPVPAELDEALKKAAAFDDDMIAESFIPGREITAAVLDGTVLPLVEIVPEGGFYDYTRKYTKGSSRYIVPAEVEGATAEAISNQAALAYRALLCQDYARIDFRLSEDGEPYCLEVNTLPGMTDLSLVPMAAECAGISFEELVERICMIALARREPLRFNP